MDIALLFTIVTFCGLVFFALTLSVYWFGKKSTGEKQDPERIKYGKLELKTSQVFSVMLLTFATVAIPPYLIYLKPELIKRPIVSNPDSLWQKDLNLVVNGTVVLEDGSFADSVKVGLIRTYEGKVDTISDETDQQGMYAITVPQAKPDEAYRIYWIRSGYEMQARGFKFNFYPFSIRLTKGGEN